MPKSLTEVAQEILMQEGQVPSMGTYDKNPERDVNSTTVNKSSLKPGSKYKEERFKNPNSDAPDEKADDLGGATPTSTAKENLGAKAAAPINKDKSRSSKSNVAAEPAKKLSEDEEATDEVVLEQDEELDAIIAEMIDAGMSDEEIEATLAEALAEVDEVIEEDVEISEELQEFIEQKIEEGLSDDEIEEAIAENFEFVTEDVSEEESEPELELPKVDMTEHVNALLEGETLSEEFRAKATTIFESAVNAKLAEEVAILEETYQKSLDEQVEQIKDTLAEQVDDYLNYVIENWIAENEVAIEPALRTELTEEFIAGLRNLFVEHYVDIPDDKVEIVEELGKKVDELEDKLNEQIESNVSLRKQLSESVRHSIVAEACEDLSDTQASRLESLVPTKTPTSEPLDRAETTSDGTGLIAENLEGPMANYVKVLGKKLPK